MSRRSLPQGTPGVARDILLPVPPSTPALPTQPPTLTVPPPSPEASEPSTAVPATVRTVKKGDQIARVALEVYGSSSNAVLDWIKKNNPQLRNVNVVDVGTQLTLPPLPAGIR